MKFVSMSKIELVFVWQMCFQINSSTSNKTTTDFCVLCEKPGTCYRNGLYQWFAQKYPSKNPSVYEYDNYVSIVIPSNKTGCKIEIMGNDGAVEDILHIDGKDEGDGKNLLWSFRQTGTSKYRISTKKDISG